MQIKKRELADAIRQQMADRGAATQLAMISLLRRNGLHISQPTLSRLLKGGYTSPPPSLVEVCGYLSIQMNRFIIKTNPTDSQQLMKALETAWDGTPEREMFLARVIRAAGRMGRA